MFGLLLLAGAFVFRDDSVLAQTGGTLAFFEPVQGTINDGNPVDEWTFDGYAAQVISLIAVTTGGDLDPIITIIGPDGRVVGENDDLDSLVRDAGLEALALPLAGAHTVRVTRYAGNGDYELTLTPGFAYRQRTDTFDQGTVSWVTPTGAPVTLAQGWLQLRVSDPGETLVALPPDAEPVQNMYFQANARLYGAASYVELGLVFRATVGPEGLIAYHFKVNTDGRWTVLAQDGSDVFALRTWTPHPALENATTWTLAVLARDREFAFFANGALLGTLIDDRLLRPGVGGAVIVNQPNEAGVVTAQVDNAVITTRLGTTYRGLPLAMTTWDSNDPGAIVAELAASGQIIPAAARDFLLPDNQLMLPVADAAFTLLGSDVTLYENFVMSARVSMVPTEGASAGCGMVYRWQDERHLDIAYVDTEGGFGVVQARDGQLATNAYDLSDMVRTDANKIIVVAQDRQVTVYVNGAMVTQETVEPGMGRIGVALLNYENARADCFLNNIWVWPLEG